MQSFPPRHPSSFRPCPLGAFAGHEFDAPACDPICIALLKSVPALRHLRLAGGRSEVSATALSAAFCTNPGPDPARSSAHLSHLTSLELEAMYEADNEVLAAVAENLTNLRRLRLASTSFDAEGLWVLPALRALTQLELVNTAGVMATRDLAEALAHVSEGSWEVERRMPLGNHRGSCA